MSGTTSPAGGGTPLGMEVRSCPEQLDAINIAVATTTAPARFQHLACTELLNSSPEPR